MSELGKIKQIIGAVIDVEFGKEQIPNIYDALVVQENNLVLETQQQLGDGVVRTVAMGTTAVSYTHLTLPTKRIV